MREGFPFHRPDPVFPLAGRVSARCGKLMLDEKGKLYNLSKDRGQRKDIAGSHPDDANVMQDAVKQLKFADILPELKET